MNFIKTRRQSNLYERASRLIEKFQETEEETDQTGRFPVRNMEILKEAGYTALTVPVEYGGEGITVYDMVLLQECLAERDATLALSIGWHLGVVAEIAERKTWEDSNVRMLMDQVLQGALINRAATEPQTGSPTRGGRPQTRAIKKGKHWVVHGRKTFTTMAPVLDYFLVTAWLEEEEVLGEFLIPKNAEGLKIDETWDMIAMRGTESHDLILHDVRLEDRYLVERRTQPRKIKANGWLLHIPACYLGIAKAARNYAVQFANEYSPNSLEGPIKDLTHVRWKIGEIELSLMKARYFLFGVAEQYTYSHLRQHLKNELSAAKLVVTNTALSVVDTAMRVAGAQSLKRSNPLQRFYRDVRAGLHNPPMDDMTILNLAQQALHTRQ